MQREELKEFIETANDKELRKFAQFFVSQIRDEDLNSLDSMFSKKITFVGNTEEEEDFELD